MPHHVNIALPIPARRTFTYTVPDDADVQCGMRALVPFGKRTLTGIIVETHAPSLAEAKPVHEILDVIPVFDATMLEFTKWMSDYYLASWGETLHAALPQGMTPESVISVSLTAPLDDRQLHEMARHAPKRAALLAALERHKGPLHVSTLQRALQSDSVASQLDALEHAGLVTISREIHGRAKAKTQKAVSLSAGIRSDHDKLRALLDELDSRAPVQARIISVLSLHHRRSEEPMVVAELVKSAKAQTASIQTLVDKGICVEHVVEVQRRGDSDGAESLAHRDETALPLHAEQQHASDVIAEALSSGHQKTFLLHGITGSGKTLVYMHAIRKARELGKSALVLVPEISLTPQLIDRFRMTFGNDIAVIHSRMSPGERYDTWRAIAGGRISIVLGVRSALFAPIASCGLIIVDEEHESSYKQDSPSPRYHARDSAVMRGVLNHAVVILGSATPSMESMYNAQTGKYHLLELHQRSDNAVLPTVRLIDVRDARKRKKMSGAFSDELLDEIKKRVAANEGVLLLQNRRGFSPRLECGDCGHIPTCNQCSVALTYHKHTNLLRCHYCGSTRPALKSCAECGSAEMAEVGVGTQRAEEELQELMERDGVKARIARVDLDSTSTKGSFRKLLTDFKNGSTDILIGTKMIAKGLDIDRVTLVGVINADLQLYVPDFRSTERTFQLLTQVAGRAGRSGSFKGEVLIQTGHPTHTALLASQLHDYHMMYNDELQHRREAVYPPYSRFVVIELTSTDMQMVDAHAQHLCFALPRTHPALQVLGPTRPMMDKLRGQFRRVIIIKNRKAEDPGGNILRHAISTALQHYRDRHAHSNVRVTVDVDSQSAV